MDPRYALRLLLSVKQDPSDMASNFKITFMIDIIEGAFGADVDYAKLVKLYGAADTEHRYSLAQCIGIRQQAVTGYPDPKHISTSYVQERNSN